MSRRLNQDEFGGLLDLIGDRINRDLDDALQSPFPDERRDLLARAQRLNRAQFKLGSCVDPPSDMQETHDLTAAEIKEAADEIEEEL